MALHSSKYQTRGEITIEISTITTYSLFKVAVHSSKDQTMEEIISCTNYCATPGNQ